MQNFIYLASVYVFSNTLDSKSTWANFSLWGITRLSLIKGAVNNVKAQFSLCRCSHGTSRCRTAGIPWCTGTHFTKNKLRSHLTDITDVTPVLPRSSRKQDAGWVPVTTEHLRCSTVQPGFMPVYPGVTQVVYGDVPVTAVCATVTCR